MGRCAHGDTGELSAIASDPDLILVPPNRCCRRAIEQLVTAGVDSVSGCSDGSAVFPETDELPIAELSSVRNNIETGHACRSGVSVRGREVDLANVLGQDFLWPNRGQVVVKAELSTVGSVFQAATDDVTKVVLNIAPKEVRVVVDCPDLSGLP